MVMIVNAVRTVDKRDFFHKLKGLRAPEALEQALLLTGTETGQKMRRCVARQFRTFDPVDIQQLIHKRCGNRCLVQQEADLADVAQRLWRGTRPKPVDFFFVCRTVIVEAVTGVAGAAWPKSKIFFRQGECVRNASSGLHPKACIQNDGNS